MAKRFGLTAALGLSVAAMALAAQSGFAQEAGQDEEVVVTGSRLATVGNAPQPIVTVTAADLTARGETSLADALEQLPALQVSNSLEQSLRDGAVSGRTGLNLRGLGTQRTLVLVNGRRHVAGFPGTAAVDTSSIPTGLVERVEVVTGGASAVYGSDAVTGVVNFVLNDDFEGQQFDLQYSQSTEGDGQAIAGNFLVGRNFGNGKGNVTVGVSVEHRSGIRRGDRPFTANNALASDQGNPALRFQVGDPLPAGVTEQEAVGQTILVAGAPRFAGTAQSLIDRATNAPPFLIAGDTRFSISATPGLIGFDPLGFFAPLGTDFLEANLDIDNNGVEDCDQSFAGRLTNNFFSGCWIVDRNTGQVRPFQDGLIAGTVNQFGGDGAEQYTSGDSLTPELTNLSINLLANYEVNRRFKPYVELKAVENSGRDFAFYNTFDDTILVRLDNPFIPDALRALADQEIAAQLALDPTYDPSQFSITIARDHVDIYDPLATNKRRTYRGVAGFQGELTDNWSYDVSLNYGRTEETVESARRLRDRFFAAADVTTDANGNAVCRISETGELPIASFLDPERFSPVPAVTFDPSECRPLNLFGLNQSSQAALDFQRYIAKQKGVIEQSVAQAVLVGDTTGLFELPGGPIGVAIGAEYREEKSDFQPDAVDQNGLAWEQRTVAAVTGKYDVQEAFVEMSFPVLADVPFADTLTFTVAGRTGNYSTIGDSSSWKADVVWAPVDDIRFRAGVSETIRAPNIAELFLAPQNVNSNPRDPCLQDNITLGPAPENRLANCSAQLGRDLSVDPFLGERTSQFAGTRVGNPSLEEETSETFTYGVVVQPRFIPGLRVSVDYWDIRIENAIATIEQDDLVAACYDADSLDNQFCAQFSRNLDVPVDAFDFGWIEQITVQDLNFSAFEASGIDFDVSYTVDVAQFGLGDTVQLRVVGTQLQTNETFPFPSEPNRSNPSLGELDFPETSLTASARWGFERLELGWFAAYQSEQTLRGVEIEDLEDWTPNTADAVWVHDATLSYEINDSMRLVAGVDNVFEEEPFLAETSIPVSALGRTFFVRFAASR